MKILSKFALMLLLVSLTASLSVVNAQTLTPDNIASPTTVNLNSVFLVNNLTKTNNELTQLNAWAVGDSGTILHWNGSRWTTQPSPTSLNLYSVFFTDPYDGWAVGGNNNNGIILRYNGTWSVWNQISFSGEVNGMDTINVTLYAVTMDTNLNAGWAVGASGTTLFWDGTTWFGFPSITANTLRNVGMIHDSTEAWTIGDGGIILYWNGAEWANMTSPTSANLYTIEMVDDTNAWAGGGNGNSGTLLRLSGSTWSVWDRINFGGTINTTAGYVTDIINATVYSISIDTETSAWAVGGQGLAMYWTATEWAGQMNATNTDLKAVSMVHGTDVGSTQAWAVGNNGRILAWTGTEWIPEIPFLMAVPLLMTIGLLIALTRKSKLFRKVHT